MMNNNNKFETHRIRISLNKGQIVHHHQVNLLHFLVVPTELNNHREFQQEILCLFNGNLNNNKKISISLNQKQRYKQ